MDSPPVDMLWVEKYRPRNLESLALEPAHRTLLQSYLDKGEIPHLLFAGPPGSGKTTVAKILIDRIDCAVLRMNASADRGIDTVRERIGLFAKVLVGARKWKVVFLDEADGLTAEAQNALRALMEDYHEQTRFILAANAVHKIISPVQSRCQVLTFGATPLKERIEILASILRSEHVEVDLPTVYTYADRYSDLRRMILAAQQAVYAHDQKLIPAQDHTITGAQVLSQVIAGQWNDIVYAAQQPTTDHRQVLVEMFWAVRSTDAASATKRHILAKAVHEGMWTPDPVVHFLGTCAELMALA